MPPLGLQVHFSYSYCLSSFAAERSFVRLIAPCNALYIIYYTNNFVTQTLCLRAAADEISKINQNRLVRPRWSHHEFDNDRPELDRVSRADSVYA